MQGNSRQSQANLVRALTPFLAMTLRVDFNDVAIPLPVQMRHLQGSFVKTLRTSGDEACSMHSVWGDWEGRRRRR